MNYWKELFYEKNAKIDRVICTTMSIVPDEVMKIMIMADTYQKDISADNNIKVTDKMMKYLLMREEGNKFFFFYDKGPYGGIQPGNSEFLEIDSLNTVLLKNVYPVIYENGVFHPKQWLVVII